MKSAEKTAVAGETQQPWADVFGQRIYKFALRVIRLADSLPARRSASRILGAQLVRSATSVAANYEEARGAMSHPDFVAKMSLAYKECRESVLWLSLIRDADIVGAARMEAIVAEALELRAILGTSLKTARQNRSSR